MKEDQTVDDIVVKELPYLTKFDALQIEHRDRKYTHRENKPLHAHDLARITT